MDSLALLEDNLRQLLDQHQELQEQFSLLKEDNLRKQDSLEQAYAELHQLKKDYHRLQIAHAMLSGDGLSDDERRNAKQRLTEIINKIDKALETLKK